MNKKGIILFLFSSLTKKNIIDQAIKQNNFRAKLLERKKIYFEELYVYKLKNDY